LLQIGGKMFAFLPVEAEIFLLCYFKCGKFKPLNFSFCFFSDLKIFYYNALMPGFKTLVAIEIFNLWLFFKWLKINDSSETLKDFPLKTVVLNVKKSSRFCSKYYC